MRATEYSDFKAELLSTGGYRTHDGNRPQRQAAPGAWTTFRYSWGLTKVFRLSAFYEAAGRLTAESWANLCFSSVTTAERLGMTVEIEGFGNRAAVREPVMYLCNHMSTTETILLPAILHAYGPFSYVAKASLAHLPFLEKAAEHMRMVPIGRKSPREDLMAVLRVGTERIRGGDSFLIYPQGSRERVFSRKVYSSIGAKLAEKAGCPIVPIVVDTRCQLRRDSGLLKKVFRDFGPVDTSRTIRVCCGPAIPADRSRVMHDAAFDWMAGKLEEWGLPTER